MNPRRANVLLTVQANAPGNELAGEPTENWEDVCRVHCFVQPLTGREYVQAQQVQSTISHKITTRFFPGANNRMRLVQRAISESDDPETAAPPEYLRIFNVSSVVNAGEKNRELEWMCEEVV